MNDEQTKQRNNKTEQTTRILLIMLRSEENDLEIQIYE